MNYEAMSDDEINHEVAKHSFDAAWLERHYGKEGMIPDYCNDWADAGAVMVENKIGIETTAISIEWIARTCSTNMSNMTFRCHRHKNPLRAAMIVFLMLADATK